jgi:hypothetical protein
MKTRVRDLILQGDKLFQKKAPFDSLCQTIAENFYPERADFTTTRTLGEEFASNLMSGYPVLARRDLANALSSMLRPPGEKWFHARTSNERINEDATALTWLDRASDVLRTMMYERRSQFIRAMKQADNDFSAFGQCVVQPEMNKDRDGISIPDMASARLRMVRECRTGSRYGASGMEARSAPACETISQDRRGCGAQVCGERTLPRVQMPPYRDADGRL